MFLETILAIDRPALSWLKRDFCLFAAIRTSYLVQNSRLVKVVSSVKFISLERHSNIPPFFYVKKKILLKVKSFYIL